MFRTVANVQTGKIETIPFTQAEIAARAARAARASTAPIVNPTPLEWMDRIPAERQAALLDALDATPEGRRFQKRMLAAREIDPKHPETRSGVAMLRAAGVLTEGEAAALLA